MMSVHLYRQFAEALNKLPNGFSGRPRMSSYARVASGCPNSVAKLEKKPKSQIVNPPIEFEAWEHERLRNRARAI